MFLEDEMTCIIFLTDCDKRAEPTGDDHRLVSLVEANGDGRVGNVRGARHLLPLVGLRSLQQHEKRARRLAQTRGE